MAYWIIYTISYAALALVLAATGAAVAYGVLYLLLGRQHALIKFLESTYVFKNILKFANAVRDNVFYLALRLQHFVRKISDGFKYSVVNILPIKYFLVLAAYSG